MADQDALACQDLVEAVTSWFDGALSSAECARLEAHLRRCSGCRTYVEQMRQTTTLVAVAAAEQLPEATREALLEAFRVNRPPGA